jgi:D-alanyl-D-alanine dipeptidase
MAESGWRVAESRTPLAFAEMNVFGEPRRVAPQFEIANAPAGGLNSSIRDLARLGSALLGNRQTVLGQRPWLEWGAPARRPTPYAGYGASGVISLRGSIYGYTVDSELIPSSRLGVVAYAALDATQAASRLARYALDAAQLLRVGRPIASYISDMPLTREATLPLAGVYRHGRETVTVRWLTGRALIETPRSAGELRHRSDGAWFLDSPSAELIQFETGGKWVELDKRRYTRAAAVARPVSPAAKVADILGDYGWEHGFVRILERDGHAYARLREEYHRLRDRGRDGWSIPSTGLVHSDTTLQFLRDASGRIDRMLVEGATLPRRDPRTLGTAVDKIHLDIHALRAEALAATPPVETGKVPSDLVNVRELDPTIDLDIAYARADNLLGAPVYSRALALLQRPAAEALVRAHRMLLGKGFGMVVHDAYRPWFVTKMFWDATPQAGKLFVADPKLGSRHNRGAAVDVTLVDRRTGQLVPMTSSYDEFSPRAYPEYDGGTSEQRWLRDLLREVMESQGFTVYPYEWWHFDYENWEKYPIGNSAVE